MRAFTYQAIPWGKSYIIICGLPYIYRAHIRKIGSFNQISTCDSTWECEHTEHVIRWWVKVIFPLLPNKPAACLDIGPRMYEAIKAYRKKAMFPFEKTILAMDVRYNTIDCYTSVNTLYKYENTIKQAKFNLDLDGIKHQPDAAWTVKTDSLYWLSTRDTNYLIEFEPRL